MSRDKLVGIYPNGMSIRDIAEVVEISPMTVRPVADMACEGQGERSRCDFD